MKQDSSEQMLRIRNIVAEPIPLGKLIPFSNHPFETYEGERLAALAKSIDVNGLISPITVRSIKEGKNYEILCGHNRVEAVKLIGGTMINAIVKSNLSDDEAERIVIEDNLNQQSFADWKFSQQIRVIKRYSKFIEENSQQGRRSDLEEDGTCVHSGHKLEGGCRPKRPKTRDKISKHLGISPTVFERYRCIAKLDEDTVVFIGMMLDEKRLGFMAAYHISQLRPDGVAMVVDLLKDNPEIKLKGANVTKLYNRSRGPEGDLTPKVVKEILMLDDVES